MRKIILLLFLLLFPIVYAQPFFYDDYDRPANISLGQSLTGQTYFNPNTMGIISTHRLVIVTSGASTLLGTSDINTNASNNIVFQYESNHTTPSVGQIDIDLRSNTIRNVNIRNIAGTGTWGYVIDDDCIVGGTTSQVDTGISIVANQNVSHVISIDKNLNRWNWTVNGNQIATNVCFRDLSSNFINNITFSGSASQVSYYDDLCIRNSSTVCAVTDFFSVETTDAITNNKINNFSVLINNTLFATTNGTVFTNINRTINSNFNIVISSSGYITKTFTNYNISNNLQTKLFRNNELLFNFRDEQTNLPILNVNYTLISSSFSISNITSNANINFTSLPEGTYELRYDSDGYNPRSAFFFVPLTPLSVINNTLYLLNLTVGDYYLPVILDENENVVPNSYFQALRWFVLGNGTGEYRVVETSSIDAQGKATLFLEFNTASYIFRILQNEVLLQTFPTPKFLFSQVEFYRFSEGSQLISSYKNLGDIQIDLQFIQSTNDFFRLEFNDPNNFASEVCLNVNFRGYNGTNVDITTTTCSIATASTLTNIVNLSQTGVFRGWISVTANNDGTVYVLDEIVFDNRYNTGFNTLQTGFMLLMLAIFLMIAILVAISSPLVGGGLIVLVLLAFSPALLGIVNISPLWIGGLILIFIIFAYIFSRGDKN